jgi:predicted transcriptional regulator
MVGLKTVQKALQAEVLAGAQYMNKEAEMACGADLMSDVLAFTKRKTLLLTGLANMQVVKTADVSDLSALVFVRGKEPTPEILAAAESKGLPVMMTKYTMFEACGRLYAIGLIGCPPKGAEERR